MPAIITAGLFAFLLSWRNFPLSLFTTGADSTLPEWLFAKMVSGYSSVLPALGILSIVGSLLLMLPRRWAHMFATRLPTEVIGRQ